MRMIGLQDFNVSRMILIAAARYAAIAPMVRTARLAGTMIRGLRMVGVQVARKCRSHGAEKRHENLKHGLDTSLHLHSYSTLSICGMGRNLLSAG
jgi:hypothetical protein